MTKLSKTLALGAAFIGLTVQPALAGPSDADNPERGLQGQTMPGEEGVVLTRPYSKGVRVVGHEPIDNRDSNLQLAWIDHCAYVSSSSPNMLIWGAKAPLASFGVAVIDVRDPRAPKQVGLLRDRGSLYASETMHAISASGRKLLAAGSYGAKDEEAFTDLYDASDCTRPKLVSTIKWPKSVHTLTLSPDGKLLYATVISPFTGNGGIQVADISDPANPRLMGQFEATRPNGTSFEFAPHELSVSADGRQLYVGVISSFGGDLNQGVKLSPPNRELLGSGGGIYIFDSSDFAAGRDEPKLRLISTIAKGGWHSVMRANIGGIPHLVGASELTACPGTWPVISNIADERKPFIAGEFRLAMNRAENCPPPSEMEKASGGLVPAPGTATLHFNDVDSATDTRMGLFNFLWAGLRIVDIRRPSAPKEVAYFKPGDGCGGHVRYVPQTGHIWLACQASGFYVLELRPAVRAALGFGGKRSR